jgi:hypothetical protein
MVVAQGEVLTAGKGADLIRTETGRSCTRQNLEKLCKQGRLPRSTVSTAPVRVLAETLVSEYLSGIDRRQTVRERPGIAESSSPSAPPLPPEGIPDYNISRARSEFEKANLLELERKTKEALLIPREQVEKAAASVAAIVRTKLLAVPTRARQRIPHLTLEEVAILDELQREALEELADGR